MGADLYISEVYDKNRKKYDTKFNKAVEKRDEFRKMGMDNLADKAQEEVVKYYNLGNSKGHFRCSYGYNFMFVMDLSWWNDFDQLLNDDRILTLDNALHFKYILESIELKKPTIEDLRNGCCFVDAGEYSPENWLKHFQEHKNELIKFLDEAIDGGYDISCSI